ncbi:hypothetical protein J8273_2421 [Carpediemonas membranifera]|uniref:Uncharacterized protein n=1 Tax=Carpediemonas membranifera TaxID=201153 RepID=A0A8J6E196_9EUKA|nr:hypothetical protein J8273_2421 [Carpediemonas membranifera]|eukprot:KAG9396069.1 hypothetical protein J8273_2421 [Carpediemonas membranifera]
MDQSRFRSGRFSLEVKIEHLDLSSMNRAVPTCPRVVCDVPRIPSLIFQDDPFNAYAYSGKNMFIYTVGKQALFNSTPERLNWLLEQNISVKVEDGDGFIGAGHANLSEGRQSDQFYNLLYTALDTGDLSAILSDSTREQGAILQSTPIIQLVGERGRNVGSIILCVKLTDVHAARSPPHDGTLDAGVDLPSPDISPIKPAPLVQSGRTRMSSVPPKATSIGEVGRRPAESAATQPTKTAPASRPPVVMRLDHDAVTAVPDSTPATAPQPQLQSDRTEAMRRAGLTVTLHSNTAGEGLDVATSEAGSEAVVPAATSSSHRPRALKQESLLCRMITEQAKATSPAAPQPIDDSLLGTMTKFETAKGSPLGPAGQTMERVDEDGETPPTPVVYESPEEPSTPPEVTERTRQPRRAAKAGVPKGPEPMVRAKKVAPAMTKPRPTKTARHPPAQAHRPRPQSSPATGSVRARVKSRREKMAHARDALNEAVQTSVFKPSPQPAMLETPTPSTQAPVRRVQSAIPRPRHPVLISYGDEFTEPQECPVVEPQDPNGPKPIVLVNTDTPLKPRPKGGVVSRAEAAGGQDQRAFAHPPTPAGVAHELLGQTPQPRPARDISPTPVTRADASRVPEGPKATPQVPVKAAASPLSAVSAALNARRRARVKGQTQYDDLGRKFMELLDLVAFKPENTSNSPSLSPSKPPRSPSKSGSSARSEDREASIPLTPTLAESAKKPDASPALRSSSAATPSASTGKTATPSSGLRSASPATSGRSGRSVVPDTPVSIVPTSVRSLTFESDFEDFDDFSEVTEV